MNFNDKIIWVFFYYKNYKFCYKNVNKTPIFYLDSNIQSEITNNFCICVTVLVFY